MNYKKYQEVYELLKKISEDGNNVFQSDYTSEVVTDSLGKQDPLSLLQMQLEQGKLEKLKPIFTSGKGRNVAKGCVASKIESLLITLKETDKKVVLMDVFDMLARLTTGEIVPSNDRIRLSQMPTDKLVGSLSENMVNFTADYVCKNGSTIDKLFNDADRNITFDGNTISASNGRQAAQAVAGFVSDELLKSMPESAVDITWFASYLFDIDGKIDTEKIAQIIIIIGATILTAVLLGAAIYAIIHIEPNSAVALAQQAVRAYAGKDFVLPAMPEVVAAFNTAIHSMAVFLKSGAGIVLTGTGLSIADKLSENRYNKDMAQDSVSAEQVNQPCKIYDEQYKRMHGEIIKESVETNEETRQLDLIYRVHA